MVVVLPSVLRDGPDDTVAKMKPQYICKFSRSERCEKEEAWRHQIGSLRFYEDASPMTIHERDFWDFSNQNSCLVSVRDIPSLLITKFIFLPEVKKEKRLQPYQAKKGKKKKKKTRFSGHIERANKVQLLSDVVWIWGF